MFTGDSFNRHKFPRQINCIYFITCEDPRIEKLTEKNCLDRHTKFYVNLHIGQSRFDFCPESSHGRATYAVVRKG